MGDQAKRDHKPLNFEPLRTEEYLQKEYWDKRFSEEEQYDWFKKFDDFSAALLPQLSKDDKILVLGCGNSSLTFDLHAAGYTAITSIDISEVVIERMRAKSEALGLESLSWQVGDMLALPFPGSSFDVVLDKGTMDVLFTDNDSPWQPKEEVCDRVFKMLTETHRVLRSNGKFISITFAQPHFRRRFFLADPFTWSMKHFAVGETFHYFAYVLEKGARSDADCLHTPDEEEKKQNFEVKDTMHEHMEGEDYLLRHMNV